MTGVTMEGTEQFRAAARALNEAADRDLRRQVYAAFRRAVRPLGEKVIAEGSARLPHRGGLSSRVARSRLSQANSTTGRNPGVTLRITSAQGYRLAMMDKGTLYHPVFARAGVKRTWKRQAIPDRVFTTPFEAGAPAVRREVIAALDQVAETVARRSGGRL